MNKTIREVLMKDHLAAFVMILISLVNVYFSILMEQDLRSIISSAIPAVGALIILFYPNKTPVKTIGIYATSMGLSALLVIDGQLIVESDRAFGFGLVTLFVSATLFCNGILCLRGNNRRSLPILYGALYQLALNIGYIIYSAHKSFTGVDPVDPAVFFQLVAFMIFGMSIYAVFAFIIISDEKRQRPDGWLIRHDLQSVRSTALISGSSSIFRNDLKKIDDGMKYKSWDRMDVDDYVVGETIIHIVDKRKDSLFMVVQQHTDGPVYASMMRDPNGSFITGSSFKISEIVPDGGIENCKTARIYGENGVFMNVTVTDEDPELKAVEKAKMSVEKRRMKVAEKKSVQD